MNQPPMPATQDTEPTPPEYLVTTQIIDLVPPRRGWASRLFRRTPKPPPRHIPRHRAPDPDDPGDGLFFFILLFVIPASIIVGIVAPLFIH